MKILRLANLSVPAVVLLLAAACSSAATPGGSPSATATATSSSAPSASATASATPAATPSTGPTESPIPLPNNAYVAAAGDGVVWMLIAQHLLVSTDRGQTWAERTWPPQAQDAVIAFVTDKTGWNMQSGSPARQCQSQKVALAATSDGANTWSGIDATGIADAQCKENLAFVDAQRGYITAYDPNGAPTIYRTTDGGKTWSGSKLPDPPGFTTRSGGFALRAGPVADFGTVQLVSAVGNTGSKQATYTFRSTDRGASWIFAGTAPDLEPAASVVFITPTRWLAPLAPAPWSETTDGGSTWHAFPTDHSQAAPVAPQIVFGDANTGYATVRGSLQRTTDGGAHWTALKTPGT